MKLLRAIVESPYEPNDINVLWIDTSLDGVPVLRKYANGFWTYVSSSGTTFIVNVDTLPEASKQTLGKMYATPSQNPHEGDTTDEWLTVISYDNEGNPVYSWEQIGQNPDLSEFITKSVNNLDNYYLKTQTFTQEEITQRINASKNLVYLVVDELPQASSSTLNSIYLVEDSQQENVYDMYITQYDESTTTYSWLNIGNTSIDLSLYATKAELAALQDAVEELDEKKADKNGSYDTMQVGSAKNLAGKNIVTDSFFERTTGGSAELSNGIAQLKEVKGHSVAWNQLIDLGVTLTADGHSSISDGVLTATCWKAAQTNPFNEIINNIIYGHKYYTVLKYKSTIGFKVGAVGISETANLPSSSEWTTYKSLVTSNNTARKFYIEVPGTNNPTTSDTVQFKDIYVFDLTLLGIDNLTTKEQFEEWLAENVGALSGYPYAMTILNNKLTGIESYGFNLLDPSTGKARIIGAYSDTYGNYYGITGTHGTITFVDYLGNSSTITPDTDDKFQLTVPGELTVASAGADCAVFFWWDGTKTEYEAYDKKMEYLDVTHIYGKKNGEGELVQVFPNGMLSAGTVKDALTVEDGVAVAKKNVDRVDLGTLAWNYANSLFYTNVLDFFVKPTDSATLPNFTIAHYVPIADTYLTLYDKRISSNNNPRIRINDSSYSDKTTFASAMSGVYLNYEMVLPETYTDLVYQGSSYFADGTPVTLPVNYQVNNWGMERLLPQNTTDSVIVTTPEVSIQYSIDAVEMLNTHSDEIEEINGVLAEKADKEYVDDTFVKKGSNSPETTVGRADNLTGEQLPVTTGYTLKATAFDPAQPEQEVADGLIALNKLQGRAVAWNQLFQPPTSYASSGITISYSNGKGICNGVVSSTYFAFNGDGFFGNENNHIYLFKLVVVKDTNRVIEGGKFALFNRSYNGVYITNGKAAFIYKNTQPSSDRYWGITNLTANSDLTGVEFYASQIDLTLLCPHLASNENLTVAQVEEYLATLMTPKPYFAQNTGTLLGSRMLGWDLRSTKNLLNPTTAKAKLFSYIYTGHDNEYTVIGWDELTGAALQFTPYNTGVAQAVTLDGNSRFVIPSAGELEVVNAVSGTDYTGDITKVCVLATWDGSKDEGVVGFDEDKNEFDSANIYHKSGDVYTQVFDGGVMREAFSVTVNIQSAHDELGYDEITKKCWAKVLIGDFDMGGQSATWAYQTSQYATNPFFQAEVPGIVSIPQNNTTVTTKLLCGRYMCSGTSDTLVTATSVDKRLSRCRGGGYNLTNILVTDSAYTDAATFKAAMSGVHLFYELATPVIYTSDLYYKTGENTYVPLEEVFPLRGLCCNWASENLVEQAFDNNGQPQSITPITTEVFNSDMKELLKTIGETYVSKEQEKKDIEAFLSCLNTNSAAVLGGTYATDGYGADGTLKFKFTTNE